MIPVIRAGALVAAAVTAVVPAVVLGTATAASAMPDTAFEMPFPCGQSWTGTSRSSHSPSQYAVDWNRTDDEGDPVVAAAPGVVSRVERWATSYGYWVRIDHPGGESTIYAHMSSITVALGQSIDQGTQVGTVGNTGNSYGAHLHFEERDGSGVLPPYFHGSAYQFGTTLASRNCVDVPLAGNFLGTDRAELAVFRRGEPSTFRIRRPHRRAKVIPFGSASDQPVAGDWDGNGRLDPGVRSPLDRSFRLSAPDGVVAIRFGRARDLPIAGDWDGDGTWEVGVRRAGAPRFVLRAADGSTTRATLGDIDDLPVTGDWNGDGRTDLGAFDQETATFTLRIVDPDGLVWTAQVPYGQPGDLPVTGDWDANGRTDLGVWNPETATFSQRRATAPTVARASTSTLKFGRPR